MDPLTSKLYTGLYNATLHKMGIAPTEYHRFCYNVLETRINLSWECPFAQKVSIEVWQYFSVTNDQELEPDVDNVIM